MKQLCHPVAHPVVIMLQGPQQLPAISGVAGAACWALDLQLAVAPPERTTSWHRHLHRVSLNWDNKFAHAQSEKTSAEPGHLYWHYSLYNGILYQTFVSGNLR